MGKRLGQHFLANKTFADRIVDAAGLTKETTVLEIGPGLGVLTERLIPRVKELIAVELDEKLIRILTRKFGGHSNFSLKHADFLSVAPFERPNLMIVANIPYYITSPIIQKIIRWPRWQSAVLTIQKEVAQRLGAAPGCREYGVLTISVGVCARAETLFRIPRQEFSPPPKVDSCAIRLTPLAKPLIEPEHEERLFALVRACFQQRRKKLLTPLSGFLGVSKQEAAALLAQAGIPQDARAEDVSIDSYIQLSRAVNR